MKLHSLTFQRSHGDSKASDDLISIAANGYYPLPEGKDHLGCKNQGMRAEGGLCLSHVTELRSLPSPLVPSLPARVLPLFLPFGFLDLAAHHGLLLSHSLQPVLTSDRICQGQKKWVLMSPIPVSLSADPSLNQTF